MTIKAVIFDLDGTLAEFNLDYKAVRAEVMQFLVNQGFPASVFSTNESIFEMLKKVTVYMANNGKKEKEIAVIQKRALSIAGEHEVKAAHETSLLPGVYETLKALKKMGLKLAIFTINGKKSTHLIMDKFRLNPIFDATITRESVLKVKPDPSHLIAALKALKVNGDEVVVVGDSEVDMKSAKALKVKAVGIATTAEMAKEMVNAGAWQTVNSIIELPALVAKLNETQP